MKTEQHIQTVLKVTTGVPGQNYLLSIVWTKLKWQSVCSGVMLCAMQPHSFELDDPFQMLLKTAACFHTWFTISWCYSTQKYWKQVFASTVLFHWSSVKEFLLCNQCNWICLLKVSLQAKESNAPGSFYFFSRQRQLSLSKCKRSMKYAIPLHLC